MDKRRYTELLERAYQQSEKGETKSDILEKWIKETKKKVKRGGSVKFSNASGHVLVDFLERLKYLENGGGE